MELISELENLLLAQPREAEHANLVFDVIPGARSAELLELLPKHLAHRDDSARHGLEVLLPLGKQGRVIEDGGSNASTVDGRVANLGALQDGELRSDAAGDGSSLVGRGGNEVECAGALAIQTQVLGKRLGDDELEPLLNEEADGAGVTIEVARSESLVGAIEEGEVLLCRHQLGDLAPLGRGGVDTCRVVGASVEEDDAVLGGLGKSALHAVNVEALGGLVEVGVGGDGNADVGEDLVVVGPCRVADVDGAVGTVDLVELGEEESAQVDGTSARDGLNRGDALLGNGGRGGANEELAGLAGEGRETGDGEILMIELGVVAEDLIGLGL